VTRIAFDVEDDELRDAIEAYGKRAGLKVSDLARTALYQYIRRNRPSSETLVTALQRIL